MSLPERVNEDLKTAMRSRDELRVSVLRMLISAMRNKEIEKRGKGGDSVLTDDEQVAVVRSEAKKRRDAIEEYTKAGRSESAAQEQAEKRILEEYLPAEMSDDELKKLLEPLVKGASSENFGRVMGLAMKAVSGRASGDRVGVMVRKLLETTELKS